MNFNILSKDAENLLEKLSHAKNPNTVLKEGRQKARDISETKENEFIGLINELKEAGCITVLHLHGGGREHYKLPSTEKSSIKKSPIKMSIETYRKRLKEHKELLREVNASGSVTNIDNSTHNSLNIDGNNNALENVGVSSGSNKKC